MEGGLTGSCSRGVVREGSVATCPPSRHTGAWSKRMLRSLGVPLSSSCHLRGSPARAGPAKPASVTRPPHPRPHAGSSQGPELPRPHLMGSFNPLLDPRKVQAPPWTMGTPMSRQSPTCLCTYPQVRAHVHAHTHRCPPYCSRPPGLLLGRPFPPWQQHTVFRVPATLTLCVPSPPLCHQTHPTQRALPTRSAVLRPTPRSTATVCQAEA